MIAQPFTIFAPFRDRFEVHLFPKADNLQSDADLAAALGDDRIASLRQIHGNRTVMLREASSRAEEADAIATDERGLWLSVRAADCQQVVVYDPVHHTAGAVHAGWKGLKAGAIPSLFHAMREQWGTDPADAFVGIGPSLCTDCAEFTDPVTELAGLDSRFFRGRHADLQGIADAQLEEIGVPAAHRERSADCTKCRNDLYWTYRGGHRENVVAGRCNVIACRLT